MKNSFLVINTSKKLPDKICGMDLVLNDRKIHICLAGTYKKVDNIIILIDGFVLPRNDLFSEYRNTDQHELIYKLYKIYGQDFPLFLKGFFNVIVIDQGNVIIANDIHSVRRSFFITLEGSQYVTNDLSCLSEMLELKPNTKAPALQAVLQHYLAGTTPFDKVFYSRPASRIILNNNDGFKLDQYVHPNYFTELNSKNLSRTEVIEIFKTTINNYVSYFKPKKISATLTGGRDTRSILAALMSLGIAPHCFTFGFPSGADVVTAKNVADICGLNFSNHYIEPLNAKSYGDLVDEIIGYNNPFIHLHRAHRLDAIKKEKASQGDQLEMVFVGAMGGDYIKGEKFNDYILTEFLRLYLTDKTPAVDTIEKILKKHYIQFDNHTVDYIQNFLQASDIVYNRFNKQAEFNLVHNIVGCTHDIQDINLFMEKVDYVMAPFMDFDVMEALFSSEYNLFSFNRRTVNPFKLLEGGELQCLLIKKLAPILADVNFANQYTPNDVLGNRIKYVSKRIYFHGLKIKSMPTFEYCDWFLPFVEGQLNNLTDSNKQLYDVKRMAQNLKNDKHQPNEGYWHKYTNPITMSLYCKRNNIS